MATDTRDQRHREATIKRINRLKPDHVAFGGVVAARHWHPNFDLNGTPRVDLHVQCQGNLIDLDFMQKLDPALKESDKAFDSPAVVVHTINRANPDFTSQENGGIPIADPVETALDLLELGLTQQANNLFAHLRKEVRFA